MKQTINKLIELEVKRQQEGLVMIASENYCPQEILSAIGSPLNNKYSEGYPGKRYYSGNQFIDEIEELARKSALAMFGLDEENWHANVQPHSGSSANLGVYLGLLEPGDKILAMDLSHGGHLTHGSPVNFSGKLFKFVHYGVEENDFKIDYDKLEQQALAEQPKMIVCGATAYPQIIDFKRFSEIAKKVNALLLADISHIAGLIVGGVHPSPFPEVDIMTSTTHKTLGGPRSAFIICKKELGAKIDKAIFPGLQGGPLENIIAGKALCFDRAQTPEFTTIQQQTVKNAILLAEELKNNGFQIVGGNTKNHLILIDLRPLNVNGKIASELLAEAGIYTNANSIPFDPAPPFKPSGLRIGTPALSTRGMKEPEMKLIADWFKQILTNQEDGELRLNINQAVIELTKKFPI
jgi:glycine hydroxymethyltransferase